MRLVLLQTAFKPPDWGGDPVLKEKVVARPVDLGILF